MVHATATLTGDDGETALLPDTDTDTEGDGEGDGE
jgi:hypothetical protein